jgi:hypothetical protein
MSENPTARHRRSHNIPRTSFSRSLRASRAKSLISSGQQICVLGFPIGTSPEDVQSAMEKFGTVTAVVPNQNPTEPIEGTIPFIVTFSTPTEAKNALDNITPDLIEGANIKATAFIPIERETRASKTILVRRIPNSTAIEDVKQIFKKFGEITLIEKVSQNVPETQQAYWKCLIHYTSFDAALEAIQEMNGMCIFDQRGLCIKFVEDQNDMQEAGSSTMARTSKLSRRKARATVSSNDLFDIALIAATIKKQDNGLSTE